MNVEFEVVVYLRLIIWKLWLKKRVRLRMKFFLNVLCFRVFFLKIRSMRSEVRLKW